MVFLKSVVSGIRLHPWRIICLAFVAFSVQWTVIEAVTVLLNIKTEGDSVKIEGDSVLIVVIVASVMYSLIRSRKLSNIVIKVPTKNTKIEIFFGDLFIQQGLRGIGVTEYFESKIGAPVSAKSLHGLLLKKIPAVNPGFDVQLKKQLSKIPSKHVDVKTEGKKKSYPIGTTALIQVNGDKYIVFAFSKADPLTCKAYSDVAKMWDGMHGLWQQARNEAGGNPLNIPLIGSGLSGIGLPARELLNLIILSVITETEKKQITQTIRIILHPDQFDEVELKKIKNYWEES